ncbi:MAG: hypothetical protein H6835_18930 [Planctomycetes bacterium]|nr:hypothetical protein [Planctomycetota bacterium]
MKARANLGAVAVAGALLVGMADRVVLAQEPKSVETPVAAEAPEAAAPEGAPLPPVTAPLLERPKLEPRPSTELELQPCARLSAEQLATHVARLVPMVERCVGRRFVTPPKVRTADGASWYALVELEFPEVRDLDLQVATTFALYLPERDEVVLSSYVASRLGDDDAGARSAAAILAHELVHVLQDQHFALPSRLRVAEDRWQKQVLRALLEGHATLIEERIMTQLGAPDAEAQMRRRHRRGAGLVYLRGRDYLASLEKEGGADAVVQALVGELPTPLEFAKRSAPKRSAEKRDAEKR